MTIETLFHTSGIVSYKAFIIARVDSRFAFGEITQPHPIFKLFWRIRHASSPSLLQMCEKIAPSELRNIAVWLIQKRIFRVKGFNPVDRIFWAHVALISSNNAKIAVREVNSFKTFRRKANDIRNRRRPADKSP